jgi:hypothetical protein
MTRTLNSTRYTLNSQQAIGKRIQNPNLAKLKTQKHLAARAGGGGFLIIDSFDYSVFQSPVRVIGAIQKQNPQRETSTGSRPAREGGKEVCDLCTLSLLKEDTTMVMVCFNM